jgi:hypothetical protein
MKWSLGDIDRILKERIEDIKDKNPPIDSVYAGIMLGLIEARNLIHEEEDRR